jgi:hypothetical protein
MPCPYNVILGRETALPWTLYVVWVSYERLAQILDERAGLYRWLIIVIYGW